MNTIDNQYITRYALQCNIMPCSDRPKGCYHFSGFPHAYFLIEVEEIDLGKKPIEIKNQILSVALQKVSRQLEKEKKSLTKIYRAIST